MLIKISGIESTFYQQNCVPPEPVPDERPLNEIWADAICRSFDGEPRFTTEERQRIALLNAQEVAGRLCVQSEGAVAA